MGEGRYRAGTTISRQFTESEAAIDKQIESHLAAPPVDLRPMSSGRKSYEWLNQELKLRSEMGNQLVAERDMAEQQGIRRELHRTAVKSQQEDAIVLDSLKRVTDRMKNNGISSREALRDEYRDRPELLVIDKFGAAAESLEIYGKSDEELQVEDLTTRLQHLNLKRDVDAASLYMQDQDGARRLVDIMTTTERGKLAAARNAEVAHRVEGIGHAIALHDALKLERTLQQARDNPDLDSFDKNAAMRNIVGPNVSKPEVFHDMFRNSKLMMGAVTNKAFIANELKEAERADFYSAINTYTDEKASPEEKARSYDVMTLVGSKYQQYYDRTGGENAKIQIQKAEQAEDFIASVNKSMSPFSKALEDKDANPDSTIRSFIDGLEQLQIIHRDNPAIMQKISEHYRPKAEGWMKSYNEKGKDQPTTFKASISRDMANTMKTLRKDIVEIQQAGFDSSPAPQASSPKGKEDEGMPSVTKKEDPEPAKEKRKATTEEFNRVYDQTGGDKAKMQAEFDRLGLTH